MAQARKYAELPDLDSAPEVYSTPELAEDVSTLPTSTIRSTSSYSDDSDNDNEGIDRRRIGADEARAQFSPSRVNTRRKEFPDHINTQRRVYRSGRRHRRRDDLSGAESGESSDDEDETLDSKLARLRREIEEARTDLEKKKSNEKQSEQQSEVPGSTNIEEGVEKLSEMLDAVYTQRQGGLKGAEAQLMRTLRKPNTLEDQPSAIVEETHQKAHAPLANSQALAKAAEIDERISSIEKSLGLSGANMPDIAEEPPKPILQVLESLDRQMNTLSTASTTTLDVATRKIRQLTQEAERANDIRAAGQSGDGESSPKGSLVRNGERGPAVDDDPEKITKINALYGALSTIEQLSPSLPLVLERLRTLRLIHASAGTASATLDEVEKRQAEQEAEIQRWREALEKAESKMTQGEEVLQGNVQTVGDWVKDLEARIQKFE